MLHWKDILCLLAILMAWGLAGHFDYEDALALEEAQRDYARQHCLESGMASPPITRSVGAAFHGSVARESEWPCATDAP